MVHSDNVFIVPRHICSKEGMCSSLFIGRPITPYKRVRVRVRRCLLVKHINLYNRLHMENSMNTSSHNKVIHMKQFHRTHVFAVPIRVGHVTIDNRPLKRQPIMLRGYENNEYLCALKIK